jgi:hypothetical protein
VGLRVQHGVHDDDDAAPRPGDAWESAWIVRRLLDDGFDAADELGGHDHELERSDGAEGR